MKLFLIGILFTTLSFAGELKTSFSESAKGFEFSLNEVSTPSEANRLWDFINSLYLATEMDGMSISRDYASQDKNFTLKCDQTYGNQGTNDAHCTGKLIKTNYPIALGTLYEGSPKFLSIVLREKMAENFSAIFIKNYGVISINLKEKFTIIGSSLYVEMQVKE